MTTDHQPLAAELHGCTLRQRNCATLPPPPATGRATGTQPTSLKAAAALVLQRNRARNPHATGAAPVCNFEPATGAAAVARVAPPLEAQSIGCCPDADVPVTVADVIRLHGALLLGQVLVADVCALADPIDLTDFLAPAEGEDRLYHFAALLVDAGAVRPLPDPALPPLERLACEIGESVAELRGWLDQSAQGRRIRARIEREAGACDRVLFGLRTDPDAGLHGLLVRVLEGHQDDGRTRQLQGDERMQDGFGAWRTQAGHERIAAYDRHHWSCPACIRAGRGYGARCEAGERLHAATRASR